jgi:hypothetical protein
VVLVDVHERRQGLEAEGLDRRAVGVGEHEELLAERAHEADGLLDRAGGEEGHPDVGLGVAPEDVRRGLQDPRALERVGVERHDGEVERGGPLGDRAGGALQGGELHVGRHVGDHGSET